METGWGLAVLEILNEQLEVASQGLVAFPTMPQSQEHLIQLARTLLDSQQEALAGTTGRKFVLVAQEIHVHGGKKNFFLMQISKKKKILMS